ALSPIRSVASSALRATRLGRVRVPEYRSSVAGCCRARRGARSRDSGAVAPPARGAAAIGWSLRLRHPDLASGQGPVGMPRLSLWLIRTALVYLVGGFALGAAMLVFKVRPLAPGGIAWLRPVH